MTPIPKTSKPVCFIENDPRKRLRVNPEAKKMLENISQPLVVVSIVGPYRSGKSYLMNQLAGAPGGGFSVGHTVEANTKGIWMWCVSHPIMTDHTLVLLDTEGLGDVSKGNSRNDTDVLSLAVLLSSTLVYNSKGTIDQDALNKLCCTAEQCEFITDRASQDMQEAGGPVDKGLVPLFVWTVRDSSLKLELQGRPVTEDEYLENSLKIITSAKTLKALEKNQVRERLRTTFPALDQNKFHVSGGHALFVKEKEQIVEKYNMESGKGVKSEEVLQEFLKSLQAVDTIISQTDQAMTEKTHKRQKVVDPSSPSQLKQYIWQYKLHCAPYHRILIQLFGFAGHGKSSFVNSCMYVLGTEGFKDLAVEGGSDGGKTISRKGYKLTDSITIVDNRGFGKMDSSEIWEIYAQLCNFVPLNKLVTWSSNPKTRVQQLLNQEENIPDLLVPVLIYSAEKSFNNQEFEKTKEFLKNAQRLTGILPFIILTKKDSGNVKCLKDKFGLLGMEQIYCVENYIISDNMATRGKHMVFLKFFKDLLDTVDYIFGDSVDYRAQQRDRRQFLIEMAFQ
ncbi:uncharacterized protein WCC33_013243 [Rhinophrynus dorsalis]